MALLVSVTMALFMLNVSSHPKASSFHFNSIDTETKTKKELIELNRFKRTGSNCWSYGNNSEGGPVEACYRSRFLFKAPGFGIEDPDNASTSKMDSVRNESDKIPIGDRIINGVDAVGSDHPWMVYLEITGGGVTEMCGGTMLSKSTVLTAKHCVSKPCSGHIMFHGVDKQSLKYNIPFDCESSNVALNEDTDLAIIEVNYNLPGHPLAIPAGEQEQPSPGTDVYVVGWGRACNDPGEECKDQSRQPDLLQTVEIQVTDDDCHYKDPNIFCAGGITDGMPKDACSGDSGGPMECLDYQSKVYQCGVVSIGPDAPDCGRRPGGYVRLANDTIIDWLIVVGKASAKNRIRTDIGKNSQRSLSNFARKNSQNLRRLALTVASMRLALHNNRDHMFKDFV